MGGRHLAEHNPGHPLRPAIDAAAPQPPSRRQSPLAAEGPAAAPGRHGQMSLCTAGPAGPAAACPLCSMRMHREDLELSELIAGCMAQRTACAHHNVLGVLTRTIHPCPHPSNSVTTGANVAWDRSSTAARCATCPPAGAGCCGGAACGRWLGPVHRPAAPPVCPCCCTPRKNQALLLLLMLEGPQPLLVLASNRAPRGPAAAAGTRPCPVVAASSPACDASTLSTTAASTFAAFASRRSQSGAWCRPAWKAAAASWCVMKSSVVARRSSMSPTLKADQLNQRLSNAWMTQLEAGICNGPREHVQVIPLGWSERDAVKPVCLS